jgi:hypothetical protein
MSLQMMLCHLQFKNGSQKHYNAIILITLSFFMFSMINYQSISATTDSTKTQSNDKSSDTKTQSNDKSSDTKTQSNDKSYNIKIPNAQDPTLSLPLNSHYADTLDKANNNNPTDIPFP